MRLSVWSLIVIRKELGEVLRDEFFRKNAPDSFNSIAWDLINDLGGMAGEW